MYFVAFILKNLTRRPIRTALTVLGLGVAVGSMIALLGLSRNFRSSLQGTFELRRVDLVVVASGAPTNCRANCRRRSWTRSRRGRRSKPSMRLSWT